LWKAKKNKINLHFLTYLVQIWYKKVFKKNLESFYLLSLKFKERCWKQDKHSGKRQKCPKCYIVDVINKTSNLKKKDSINPICFFGHSFFDILYWKFSFFWKTRSLNVVDVINKTSNLKKKDSINPICFFGHSFFDILYWKFSFFWKTRSLNV